MSDLTFRRYLRFLAWYAPLIVGLVTAIYCRAAHADERAARNVLGTMSK